MSSTPTIYTRTEIEEMIKFFFRKEFSSIHQELDKIRNKIADLDTLLRERESRKNE